MTALHGVDVRDLYGQRKFKPSKRIKAAHRACCPGMPLKAFAREMKDPTAPRLSLSGVAGLWLDRKVGR